MREQTLQELEGTDWGEPPYDSHLVTERYRLRRVPLNRLRIEDLRLLIGQGDGLQYLVPIALQHLENYPFAKGDFYPGDLLKNVASVEEAFWTTHPPLRAQLIKALDRALERIHRIEVPLELPAELRSYSAHHRGAAAGAA